jgi:hypothetical protein
VPALIGPISVAMQAAPSYPFLDDARDQEFSYEFDKLNGAPEETRWWRPSSGMKVAEG